MNACTFCKRGKRKCDKARPSCANCVRLHKVCVYAEDTIQTHFDVNTGGRPLPMNPAGVQFDRSLPGIGIFGHETIRRSTVDIALQIFGSFDNIFAISDEFFTGTHQRIPALSKLRFYRDLQSANNSPPRADFAALCLSILLIQQMPSEMTSARSSLYSIVKNIINSLETNNIISLDLAHCRILISFYEMGHGLHTAAYLSLAASARTARVLGLHRKTWRKIDIGSNKLTIEEEKRTWWAIAIMDRFICLCNGDAFFVTDDPERKDPLPIEDLLWSEGLAPQELEGPIAAPPSLDTPVNITVGQMARECQISHLVGRVVRHVFNPTPDPDFNAKEGIQLERTLKAYLPLLAQEELKIGKYCAAFGMCNSALFILYESTLSRDNEDTAKMHRVLKSMEETSLGALTFSEASYMDRDENYPSEILSPYLPYSLYQAAVIQYRLWKRTDDPSYKRNVERLKDILVEFTKRWAVAEEYITIIKNFDGSWPPIAVPFQASLINPHW